MSASLFRRFAKDEEGAGSAWALMWAVICIVLGGLAVDGSNAWRTDQMLRATADVAAHAGALVLLNGGTEAQARTAAVQVAHANMPTAIHGDVLANPGTNISFSTWDEGDQTAEDTEDDETSDLITVIARRDSATNTRLTTYFLRFAGFTGFNVRARSSVTYQDPEGCENDGMFAHGLVTLASNNVFSSEYCVHSQDRVWMPQRNEWASGTTMSMPDLADCGNGKCENAANPGIEEAMAEANFELPVYSDYVSAVIASFNGTGDATIKNNFFATRSRSGSVGELADTLGVEPGKIDELARGSVVNLTEGEFEQLSVYPGGLTYKVTCTPRGQGTKGPSDGKLLITKKEGGSELKDLAIVTNCQLLFDGYSVITNSAVMTTDLSEAGIPGASASVSGRANAFIGLNTDSCRSEQKTTVLSNGDFAFAASISTNNVAFISGGDIHLASASFRNASHLGSTFYADGEVMVTSLTDIQGCPNATNEALVPPQQKIIRFVHPS